MANIKLTDDTFGPLLPFIQNRNITGIRWDGANLWIDDLTKGKYRTDIKLTDEFINKFTQRVADSNNESFNASCPVLEGDTDSLRIACIHKDKTNTGTAITIRRTEAECRLNDKTIIETDYCDEKALNLLQQLVKARCSFVVTGDTGSGKTELVKYLMRFIPDKVTTLTVEDNYELRAKALRPTFDCTEIKFDDKLTPQKAIKASLRQDTKWLILSEARSREAANLIEAASTGCSIMTTIHSWDVKNIPDRFESMIGSENTTNDVKNDVFNFFDVGVLIIRKDTPNGVHRYINQICFFEHQPNKNIITQVMDDGELLPCTLPRKIRKKFELYDIEIPDLFKEPPHTNVLENENKTQPQSNSREHVEQISFDFDKMGIKVK